MSFLRLQKIKPLLLFTAVCGLMWATQPAFAQDTPAQAPEAVSADTANTVEILPAKSLSGDLPYVDEDETTHPPLRLTPDKSELIRLDQEAGTVIVGNPAHLSVVADSAHTLVLVPKAPGATFLVVLNRKGEAVMQRHVIVASPKEKYVRIRKSCANAGKESCQATQVYYCPDMCHEVMTGVQGKDDAKKDGSIEDKLKDLSKDIDSAVDEGAEEGDESSE